MELRVEWPARELAVKVAGRSSEVWDVNGLAFAASPFEIGKEKDCFCWAGPGEVCPPRGLVLPLNEL